MTNTTHGHCAGNTHARPKKAETTTLSALAPDTNLVFLDNGHKNAFSDSLTVAREFGKDHDKVMRDIRSLDCSAEFSSANFGDSDYVDGRGKSRRKHTMSRNGFLFLVMGYRGEKAATIKEQFIAAFNSMETYIQAIAINRIQAQPARIDGKGHRREFTDAIGHLVELSKAQGSLNGRFLYGHLTKHIYKSLGLFSGAAVPDGLRDRLTARELHDCSMLEAVMARRIDKLLAADDGTSYKTIRDAGCDAATQTAGLLEAA